MFILKASEIYLENKILNDACVAVENGCISGVGIEQNNDSKIIDLGSLRLFPGFIDIHVHGGNGYDTMDATFESVNEISKYKIMEGVTSFCPTTVTSDRESLIKALECIKKAKVQGARIVWPFIEGPFVNFQRKGAHSGEFVDEAPDERIYDLVKGYGSKLSILMAPEIYGAMDIIKGLNERGINVRIGHSNADYEIATQAANNGSNIVVHMFNAMAPFSAREPGILAAGLLNDDLYTEVICDLVHSHKACLELLFRIKNKDKIILITDCMQAGGMGDGKYKLGREEVIVEGGIARTLDGNLAGSTLKMIDAVKNVHGNFNMELIDIVNMASINPARALGIDGECGSIVQGKRADMIAVDENLDIKFVMVDGVIKMDRR